MGLFLLFIIAVVIDYKLTDEHFKVFIETFVIVILTLIQNKYLLKSLNPSGYIVHIRFGLLGWGNRWYKRRILRNKLGVSSAKVFPNKLEIRKFVQTFKI